MFKVFRKKIMVRPHVKRDKMLKYSGPICCKIKNKVEKAKHNSRHWAPIPSGYNSFEVCRGKVQFVVNLIDKTCTCYKWNVIRIPYYHTINAIYYLVRKFEDYVHQSMQIPYI